jgi:outer membrane lipoprotein-sorting protein
MKKKYWSLGIIFLLILSLLAAGCGGDKQLTPQQISEKVIAAYANTKTYKMDLTMNQEMSMQVSEKDQVKFAMETTGTGAIDSAAESMHVSMDMKIKALEGPEEMRDALSQQGNMKMEMYFLNNNIYIYMDLLNSWMKQEVPADLAQAMWGQQDQMNQQIELLKDAEISVLNEESIDNTPCYVVSAKINPEALKKQMEQQITQFAQAAGSQLPAETGDIDIKEYNFTYWVDKESFFIRKTDFTTIMNFPITAAEEGEQQTIDNEMKMTGSIRYYDLNQPTNIKLPAEAESAQTVPMLGE